ncbi:MAG TPA: GAF domain-containing sensor histidine kinase [Anaerolineae bacterium]|nr:GAF domain-containing sensor histidine kinase [Anaerolineae bacterium]MCB0180475.1 GAF domain-containing sensor histidine kinase [Anaerolineae bacterium]MCB0223049.1 GAF domain-containing sensor histidine kinase [Anaerolineae bacterium]MCB9103685.1 GAF domain-containing sensor histidine kinase [Anaerolineales bacterium]HRV90758.1 GAF domain-containing sensor histidine kinase [Anaerolineae bacterium]
MVNEQNVTEQNNNPPDRFKLDWLVSNLRWLWYILAALVIFGGSYLSEGVTINTQLLTILGVGVALNLLYAGLLWAGYFPNWLAVVSVVIDVGFAIALLLLLSSYVEFLLPLAVFPVLIASLRWNVEAGLIAAVPLIIIYAAPIFSIYQESENINRDELLPVLLDFGMNGLTLLFVGILPGLFVDQRVKVAQESDARELEQLRVANKRSKIISDLAVTLSSTLDYRKVLRTALDSAYEAISAAAGDDESTVGVVLLFEGDDGRLTVVAGRNIARNLQGRKISAEGGLISRTLETAETTITYSAQNEKALTYFSPRCRSAICAPLRAGYNTYGVILFCSTHPKRYTQEHKELLTTFCSQSIIALQNAQLFDDVRFEQQKILEKEAEARRKLARDLHDGPTQSIAAIAMRLNFIKMVVQNNDLDKAYDELVKVEDIAQSTTKEIRTMLFAMRPVILETQGLVPALEQYANRLNETEEFRVNILERNYNGQLNKEAEGVMFAIVEEAVGNAKKHAEASEIKISVIGRDDSLLVEIRDNGVGFDVDATTSTYDQRTSLGLINMNERAELVGGHCVLESARGKGTTVKVEIPYHNVKDAVS